MGQTQLFYSAVTRVFWEVKCVQWRAPAAITQTVPRTLKNGLCTHGLIADTYPRGGGHSHAALCSV